MGVIYYPHWYWSKYMSVKGAQRSTKPTLSLSHVSNDKFTIIISLSKVHGIDSREEHAVVRKCFGNGNRKLKLRNLDVAGAY